jgi:hypothetical protein
MGDRPLRGHRQSRGLSAKKDHLARFHRGSYRRQPGVMMPIRVLLQTTIERGDDDWHIGRFSMLREHLAGLRAADGAPLCEITARDRATGDDDPVLAHLSEQPFDQAWIFAVDTGNGLTARECEALFQFHARGGGVLTARDHQDLGASLRGVRRLGSTHHFHRYQPEADETRRQPDDLNQQISWPNYHSGWNGDLQQILATDASHPLLLINGASGAGATISLFPAHPHEGAIAPSPEDPQATVVAQGRSSLSGRAFNLVVATERTPAPGGAMQGRVVAHSSFHHFCDYNWNLAAGAPSFVNDPPGSRVAADPNALDDIKAYVRNAVLWLSADGGAQDRHLP